MHLFEPYLLPLSVHTYTIVSGEGSHRLPHRKVVKQRLLSHVALLAFFGATVAYRPFRNLEKPELSFFR